MQEHVQHTCFKATQQRLFHRQKNGKVRQDADTKDKRHSKSPSMMRYLEFESKSAFEAFIERPDAVSIYLSGDKTIKVEGGVWREEKPAIIHDCEAWTELGHVNSHFFLLAHSLNSLLIDTLQDGLIESADRHGNGSVRRFGYNKAWQSQVIGMDQIIKLKLCASDKKVHDELCKSHKAGKASDESVGPYLGKALVWKYQVDVHLDDDDVGLCAITCMGEFEGAILVIPQLRLKIR